MGKYEVTYYRINLLNIYVRSLRMNTNTVMARNWLKIEHVGEKTVGQEKLRRHWDPGESNKCMCLEKCMLGTSENFPEYESPRANTGKPWYAIFDFMPQA